MDLVFKALADSVRRRLLDRLFSDDGLTLAELCEGESISRQGVSKHLALLEEANLVVTVWTGREKRHYLNPIPVQDIANRWIGKYARRRASAIAALREALEDKPK